MLDKSEKSIPIILDGTYFAIQSSSKYICTTADAWSACGHGYLSVTAHWLAEECLLRTPSEGIPLHLLVGGLQGHILTTSWQKLSLIYTMITDWQLQAKLSVVLHFLTDPNSICWPINVTPDHPFYSTWLWHWSICVSGHDSWPPTKSPRHMLFEVCRRSYRSYPRSYLPSCC